MGALFGMNFHMKTTLIIPDTLMKTLKKIAAETGQTLSDVVAGTLQRGLENQKHKRPLSPLPTYDMGGKAKVDISDRDALYRAMEGEEYFRRRY